MSARIEIPFAFYYPSGPGLSPAASVSVAVYVRNSDGSRGASASVFSTQSGSSPVSSLATDSSGNVPGWVNEGTYQIVASASGSFPGGTINFDALYGGGTSLVAAGAIGSTHLQSGAIDMTQLTTAVTQSLVPSGVYLEYSGTGLPAGYLWCDGSSYATSAYSNLFSAIGYQFGGSDGRFNVPDTRGRLSVGAGGGAGLTARTLAQIGGEEAHSLAIGELPTHSHSAGVNDPGHGHSVYDPGHGHGLTSIEPAGNGWSSAWSNSPNQTSTPVNSTGGSGVIQDTSNNNWGLNNGSHAHQITFSGTGIGIYGAYTGISVSTDNQPSRTTAHNNMQPFLALNHIIKY